MNSYSRAKNPLERKTPADVLTQMWATSYWKMKALAMALVSIGLLLSQSVSSAAVRIGDHIPDLADFKLEGTVQPLKGKVVLVDFWASWCGPCGASFPVMEKLMAEYGQKGFTIVAVSVDEKTDAMQSFLKKHNVSFSVVRDVEHKLVAAFSAEAMPTSFLIDATGRVRYEHKGFKGEATHKKYLEQIEILLKEKP